MIEHVVNSAVKNNGNIALHVVKDGSHELRILESESNRTSSLVINESTIRNGRMWRSPDKLIAMAGLAVLLQSLQSYATDGSTPMNDYAWIYTFGVLPTYVFMRDFVASSRSRYDIFNFFLKKNGLDRV